MIEQLSQQDLILETDRLILTPLCQDDLDIVQAVLTSPDVMRFVDDPMTTEQVDQHMKKAVKRGAGGRIGIWMIRRKDTGQKIGDAVLMPLPIEEEEYDWGSLSPDRYPDAQIEVGYLLIPDAWGQGFATEACKRVLRFGFEQTTLPEIVAVTDPDNHNSQHVLQKSGLKPFGKRRAYAWDDCSWFRITREE